MLCKKNDIIIILLRNRPILLNSYLVENRWSRNTIIAWNEINITKSMKEGLFHLLFRGFDMWNIYLRGRQMQHYEAHHCLYVSFSSFGEAVLKFSKYMKGLFDGLWEIDRSIVYKISTSDKRKILPCRVPKDLVSDGAIWWFFSGGMSGGCLFAFNASSTWLDSESFSSEEYPFS